MDKFKAIAIGSLPSLAVIAGMLLLRGFGALQNLELMVLDPLMRLRPSESVDPRIVIIGIQESDLQQLGSYPVSDRTLAQTIQTVAQLQPAAIGIDIFRDFAVPPGQAELKQAIQTTPNLFVAYRYTPDPTGTRIAAPPIARTDQQGFVDVQLDLDGNLRRLLLGFQDPLSNVHVSLWVRLAEAFLAQTQQELQVTDEGLQIADRVYPFVTEQFGSYHNVDAGGDQLLLNPRQRHHPFRQFSLADVQQGRLRAADVQGKVVLIGLTAISIKDTVNAMAILRPDNQNQGQVNGVEVQAHAVSQLISALRDRRPLIQSWSDAAEFGWILGCGVAGVLLGRLVRTPLRTLAGLGVGLGAIVGASYGLLILGWWIPLVPAALVFVLNVGGLMAAQIYQREQDLRIRLRDRQQILEQTFTAVHNGPLQDLAGLARLIQDVPGAIALTELAERLQTVNQELRGIFESTRFTNLDDPVQIYLSSDKALNLHLPLHELLEQVYNETCARELSGLAMVAIKIVQFRPMDAAALSLEQKQALCRFLEEALVNVGKHARSATKLWVECGQDGKHCVIRVKDNGTVGVEKVRSGSGTKQAKRLARKLGGEISAATEPAPGHDLRIDLVGSWMRCSGDRGRIPPWRLPLGSCKPIK